MSENTSSVSGGASDAANAAILTEWEQKDRDHANRLAESLEINKAVLFGAMIAAGITMITVEFDGYGDEGQVEDAVAYTDDTQVAMPHDQIEIFNALWGVSDLEPQMVSVGEAVVTMAWAVLCCLHGGWQDGEGAFGTFEFGVKTRAITLDFNERYTETTNYTHEL